MCECGYVITTEGIRSPFSPTVGCRDQNQISRLEWQILSLQWPDVAIGTSFLSGGTHMLSPRGALLCH